MRTLRRFLALPPEDRSLLLRALLLLGLIRLALPVLRYRRLRAALVPWRHPSGPASPADRIVRAVEAADRRLPRAGHCLSRALAAEVLLARGGHPSCLRFGVAARPGGQGIEAHAWVEDEAGALPAGPARYAPLSPR